MDTVNDYSTGDTLPGCPSDELAARSADAGPTGAVAAYQDASGVWQYVADADESSMRASGHAVVVVYVD